MSRSAVIRQWLVMLRVGCECFGNERDEVGVI